METMLKELQDIIGYHFEDEKKLLLAMTHSSFANESHTAKNFYNERIEFLGDAVLELVSSEYFFLNMPDKSEGEMSKTRASMVCEPTLAFCARAFGMEKYIRLGKGEELTGGRSRDSIISDALESLIGAIYLDGGLEPAKEFILRYILNDIEHKCLYYDSKSSLQEIVQGRYSLEPEYSQISEAGPDHNKIFTMQVSVDGNVLGVGSGRNKKAAQQAAAMEALKKLLKKEQ